MMPANVFQLELASTFADRRSLLLRLGVPPLLALPMIASAMPVEIQASAILVLLLFPTFLGAAVATARRRGEGQWRQLAILPMPRWRVHADFVLASAAVDLLQMAGVIALFAVAHARFGGWAQAAAVAGWLCAAVLLLNVLGLLVGWAGRSSGEVHLVGALAVGVLALLSGLFGAPPRLEPIVRIISAYSPLWRLRRALAALAAPTAAPTASELAVALAAAALLAAALVSRARGPMPGRQRPSQDTRC